MGFHNLHFLICQPSLFVQNGVRYGNFSNIMQCCRTADFFTAGIYDEMFRIFFVIGINHNPGQILRTLNMFSGIQIPEFHQIAQSINNIIRILPVFFLLLFYLSLCFNNQRNIRTKQHVDRITVCFSAMNSLYLHPMHISVDIEYPVSNL